MIRGTDGYRCTDHARWRHGRAGAELQKCRAKSSKGASINHVTPLVRRTVHEHMGYELWLYEVANQMFEAYAKRSLSVGRS